MVTEDPGRKEEMETKIDQAQAAMSAEMGAMQVEPCLPKRHMERKTFSQGSLAAINEHMHRALEVAIPSLRDLALTHTHATMCGSGSHICLVSGGERREEAHGCRAGEARVIGTRCAVC